MGLLIHTKTLLETINTAAAVNQLLSASEERMALGADFYSDVLLGGTSLYNFAASAGDGSGLVVGMDSLFHRQSPLSKWKIST